MDRAISRLQNHPQEERILFLKSWDEWAEGNIIEPDAIFGHGLINAMRNSIFYSVVAAPKV
jgi:hypothetical protein